MIYWKLYIKLKGAIVHWLLKIQSSQKQKLKK